MKTTPARFLITNAVSIAAMAAAHGPGPPQLTGDPLHDQSLFDAWMSGVALLAQGHESGCHDGSTFKERIEAAKALVAADQGMTTSESRMIKHRNLPVSAPEEFWTAMKWQVYSNTDIVGSRGFDNSGEADRLLAVAVTKGMVGVDALAFVTEEIDRQHEESCRSGAARAEASAISKLADALKAEKEDSVLSRIMSRLSERTQFAVKAQLKR